MRNRRSARRRGLSAVEVVATTAIGLTFGFAILLLVRMAAQRFLSILTILVGWPLL